MRSLMNIPPIKTSFIDPKCINEKENWPKPKDSEHNTSFYSHAVIFIHLVASYQGTDLALS